MMSLYVVRRLLGIVPVLVLVALGSFLLVHLVPGDPAMVMLGSDATPQQLQMLKTQMGLDRSLPEQFAVWVREVLRGNLGESFFLGRPVAQALMERLPATMQLALLALLFSLLIGIPAGILAAVRQNTWWDQMVMVTAMGGISIPSFWLGLALILVFSVQLGWLPSGGYAPLWEEFGQGLRTLILPAISLGFMQAALIARMTRSSMLEVLRQDYVRTATGGDPAPCAQECDDPRHHHHRDGLRRPLGRRGNRGDRLHLSGPRPAGGPGGPAAGLPPGPGGAPAHVGDLCPSEPGGGPPVWDL